MMNKFQVNPFANPRECHYQLSGFGKEQMDKLTGPTAMVMAAIANNQPCTESMLVNNQQLHLSRETIKAALQQLRNMRPPYIEERK
jgi:hypothetical protein